MDFSGKSLFKKINTHLGRSKTVMNCYSEEIFLLSLLLDRNQPNENFGTDFDRTKTVLNF